MSETTFENAVSGDRVYSPLFKSKNIEDKTNARIYTINNYAELTSQSIEIIADIDTGPVRGARFTTKGEYYIGGGQVLFWENPIKEIPCRPKRMVKKTGYIGVWQDKSDVMGVSITDIYATKEALKKFCCVCGQILEVEYYVEE